MKTIIEESKNKGFFPKKQDSDNEDSDNEKDNDSKIFGRILSIQSHVVRGYVGNKSSVLPLQLLGFDVDNINSVQFSNHTGYPKHRGTILSGEELMNLFEGLKDNNLHNDYTHIITGYIGNKSFLNNVMKIINELRENKEKINEKNNKKFNENNENNENNEKNINKLKQNGDIDDKIKDKKIKKKNKKPKKLIYSCDPVLGDDNTFYTSKELIDIYRDKVIPMADIVTPNQFEVEVLTGIKIINEEDVKKAIEWFHSKGVSTVIITSVLFPERSDELVLYASTTIQQKKGFSQKIKIPFKKKKGYYSGVGDLITALITGWTTIHHGEFEIAIEKSLASVQKILKSTPSNSEIKIIQNRFSIISPKTSNFKSIHL